MISLSINCDQCSTKAECITTPIRSDDADAISFTELTTSLPEGWLCVMDMLNNRFAVFCPVCRKNVAVSRPTKPKKEPLPEEQGDVA